MTSFLYAPTDLEEEIKNAAIWKVKASLACPKCLYNEPSPFATFDIEYIEAQTKTFPPALIVTCKVCGYQEYFRPADTPREPDPNLGGMDKIPIKIEGVDVT